MSASWLWRFFLCIPTEVCAAVVFTDDIVYHSCAGQLVLRALSKPAAPDNVASPIEPIATSPTSDISSPTIASPLLSTRTKLNTPRRALDMLVFILRNVDNPANYPQEVRINVCSLLLQLTKHTLECDLMRVKETVRSTLVKLTNRLQSATGKDERLRNSIQKVLTLWNWPMNRYL